MSGEASQNRMIVGGTYLYQGREWIYHRDDGHGNALLWSIGTPELQPAPYSQLKSVARIRGVQTEFRQLSEYPPRHREEAQRKLEIVLKFLLEQRTKQDAKKAAEAIGCSLSTFSRTIERFILSGGQVSSLIPRVGQFGKRNARLDPEREEIIREAIQTEYLTSQKIRLGRLVRIAQDRCEERSLPKPSRETITDRVRGIPPKDAVKAREGAKAAREMFRLNKGRMSHPGGPLHEIQIDHTQIDIFVVLPNGERVRPWLTLAIDVYTRMIVGFYLSLEKPSAYSVGMCLYRVLTPREDWLLEYGVTSSWPCYGRPREIGSDNGNDFRGYSLKRIALNHNLNWTFRELQNTERGSYIESMMGTVALELEVYRGAAFGSLTRRKDYPSEAMATFTFREVEKIFLHFFIEIYHNSPHRGLNQASPLGRWKEYQETRSDRPNEPPMFQASEELRYSLWPSIERGISKDGVSWEKIDYSDDVLEDWVRRENPNHPEGKHIFHYNPCAVRTIRWKHPISGLYLPISARDTGAVDCTQWEREALLGAEDKADRARVAPEIVAKGRKEIQNLVNGKKDLSLKEFRKAKRETKNYKSRKAKEEALKGARTDQASPSSSSVSPSESATSNQSTDFWSSTLSFKVTNL